MPEDEKIQGILPQQLLAACTTAVCSMCRIEKPLTLFTKDSSQKNGRRSSCKSCKSAKDAARYRATAARVKEKRKQRYHENSEAIKAKQRAQYAENPRKYAAKKKAWGQANKDKLNDKSRQYRALNREYIRARDAVLRAENREHRNRIQRQWRAKNLPAIAAQVAKRRAAQRQRTPKWLTREDFRAMRLFYELAKGLTLATGVPHHVDHILPLHGEFVSGLHVPSNLQILTAFENMQKNNKWDPGETLK